MRSTMENNEPIASEQSDTKQRAEPEKKRTAEHKKDKAEPEKKRTAELENYQAEPEMKRVAKRQQYWKCSEPGCLANRVRNWEAKYAMECHRKSTTDKDTQRYVVHVHVLVATCNLAIDIN